MNQSIKRYLLANLLVGVQFATLLAILSNLYLGYKSIRPHLDAQMVVMAYSINVFLSEDINNEIILNKLHQKTAEYVFAIQDLPYDNKDYLDALHTSLDNIQFRVYDTGDKLIAASPRAPDIEKIHTTGFFKIIHQGQEWRVFNLRNNNGERIVIMQPHKTRLFIEKNANLQAIMVILLTIPPLGLFIWIIIGRSLQSLTQTSYEIRQRAHNNLEPIATHAIPVEILPIIHELNNLFTRLHDNFQREKRFAGDAAHELKTPLAALKTHAQVAEQMTDLKAMQAELKKVIEGVDRASHTVDQLLILSRMMPDAYTQKHTAVVLADVVTTCVAQLAPKALKKDITISFQDLSSSAYILGHHVAIEIMVRNIVDNAIRYCGGKCKIEVLVEQRADSVCCQVTDEGPGIPENILNRVFERFYRIVGSQENGSGLGLNIVQHIAALHDAKVLLKNREDQNGLTVSIIFPLHIPKLDP